MDPNSDADQVMEFVGGLMERLEGLQKKAFTYKSYQKNFKVHVCVCVCVIIYSLGMFVINVWCKFKCYILLVVYLHS